MIDPVKPEKGPHQGVVSSVNRDDPSSLEQNPGYQGTLQRLPWIGAFWRGTCRWFTSSTLILWFHAVDVATHHHCTAAVDTCWATGRVPTSGRPFETVGNGLTEPRSMGCSH